MLKRNRLRFHTAHGEAGHGAMEIGVDKLLERAEVELPLLQSASRAKLYVSVSSQQDLANFSFRIIHHPTVVIEHHGLAARRVESVPG
jgi:hypothetical protein